MQIKIFKAATMKEAMTAMKAELGDDAVILHSKKYREGGILGIGSREVVEITAAVEEEALPKPAPRPTAPSSVLSRYKTDGTAEGVAVAEQSAEPAPSTQIDTLAEKISEQKNSLAQADTSPEDFEALLQAAQEPAPVDESSQADETSATADETSQADETPSPIDESSQADETPSPDNESSQADETPSTVDESSQADETSAPDNESSQADETPSTVDESSQADETSAPDNESSQADKSPAPTENPPSQAAPTFTQEQMAQTQAMIMAQFNQMQMMQQAAIAQAQAQAAEQIRLQQAQAQAQQPPPAQVDNSQNEEKIRRLEEEIAQMKALLAEVLGRESKRGSISLHEAMKLQEVDEEILAEMATQSNAGDTLADVHTPAAKSTLTNYLNEHVKFSDGIKLNRHGVRIAALLGTTGVGKTTTLAKIAAKFVLEQRTSVALITADTYRISAVEQLKTYADILELPLEIVYNPAELMGAIERHRDKELILIDTAGRSQHNDYQLRELEDLLHVNPRIEKHLVISATTKLTDARQIINKFAKVSPDKIVFTKIDETGSLGMIINLLRDKPYELSYITTGQSVPDDIERANSDMLTDLLLKKVDEQ